jgi:hypothetical protein
MRPMTTSTARSTSLPRRTNLLNPPISARALCSTPPAIGSSGIGHSRGLNAADCRPRRACHFHVEGRARLQSCQLASKRGNQALCVQEQIQGVFYRGGYQVRFYQRRNSQSLWAEHSNTKGGLF